MNKFIYLLLFYFFCVAKSRTLSILHDSDASLLTSYGIYTFALKKPKASYQKKRKKETSNFANVFNDM